MEHKPTAGPTRPGPAEAEQPSLFGGFEMPDQNWSKLPHALIEALPIVETVSELKVLLYVLRHTWGFQEFGITKRITLDEFQHGRKRRDGSRLDGGTGLSLNGIKDGVRRAVAHGFLVQEVERRRDRGRRSHLYCLKMSDPDTRGSESDTPGVRDRYPDDTSLTPGLAEPDTRSEKDTIERNGSQIKRKEEEEEERKEEEPVVCPLHNVPMELISKDGDTWHSHQLPDGTWCKGEPGDGLSQVNFRDWTPEERRWVNDSLREVLR